MGESSRPYQAALEQQRAKIDEVERTPSARLLAEMRGSGETFFQLAQRMSRMHKDYFLDLYPPNESRLAEFAQAAEQSIEEQARIEASDKVDFDTLPRPLPGGVIGGRRCPIDLHHRLAARDAARAKHSLAVELHDDVALAVDRDHAALAALRGELFEHDFAHGLGEGAMPEPDPRANLVGHA